MIEFGSVRTDAEVGINNSLSTVLLDFVETFCHYLYFNGRSIEEINTNILHIHVYHDNNAGNSLRNGLLTRYRVKY